MTEPNHTARTVRISKTQDGDETTWYVVGYADSGAAGPKYLISDRENGPPQRTCWRPHGGRACRVHTGSEWLRFEAIR